jgi:hypothetical protein
LRCLGVVPVSGEKEVTSKPHLADITVRHIAVVSSNNADVNITKRSSYSANFVVTETIG